MSIQNINVRFFIYDENLDGEVEIVEVDEIDFLEASGEIEYRRDTDFENGVRQIWLTKDNGYGG